MTFSNAPYSDIKVRPARIRFLAEIPLEKFQAIQQELAGLPDWDRYFIMQNPPTWPEGMYEVISRHLENQISIA